jgi:hypothetical protein
VRGAVRSARLAALCPAHQEAEVEIVVALDEAAVPPEPEQRAAV